MCVQLIQQEFVFVKLLVAYYLTLFILTTILFIAFIRSHDLTIGGTYHLNIEIPASYPFNPPKVGVADRSKHSADYCVLYRSNSLLRYGILMLALLPERYA